MKRERIKNIDITGEIDEQNRGTQLGISIQNIALTIRELLLYRLKQKLPCCRRGRENCLSSWNIRIWLGREMALSQGVKLGKVKQWSKKESGIFYLPVMFRKKLPLWISHLFDMIKYVLDVLSIKNFVRRKKKMISHNVWFFYDLQWNTCLKVTNSTSSQIT